MHTAKLHGALHCIGAEFDSGKVIEKLAQLQGALDTSVQSASQQNTKAFHRACGQLEKLLQTSATNLASPSMRGIFERIGALPCTGQGTMGAGFGDHQGQHHEPSRCSKANDSAG